MKRNKNIMLIEDDQKKIEDIKNFISQSFKDIQLITKESYQSGLKELIRNHYELLLLDMSIPTWDKNTNHSGGDYQKFGGYRILKELSRKGKLLPTVLISMFDEFGESDRTITLKQIDDLLKKEYPEKYIGAIFYSASQTEWKDNLKSILQKAI